MRKKVGIVLLALLCVGGVKNVKDYLWLNVDDVVNGVSHTQTKEICEEIIPQCNLPEAYRS